MNRLRMARRSMLLAVALLAIGLTAPAVATPISAAGGVGDEELNVTDSPADMIRDLSLACPSGQVPRGGFNDVAGGSFGLAVDCLSWYDITQGVGNNRYDQDGDVTRGQMANFLYRLIEHAIAPTPMPTYDGNSRFSDVASGSNQAAAINVLSSSAIEDLLGERIVTGYADGSYGPGDPVLREQMGTFVARTLEGLFEFFDVTFTPGFCTFRDSFSISGTHRDNVSLICSFGIAGGRADGTYGPREHVSRGQMAAFLMRLVDNFGEVPAQGGGAPIRLIPLPS